MKEILTLFIAAFVAVVTTMNFIVLFQTDISEKEDIFNPIVSYEYFNVNWFGCILITLLSNIILILPAIVYWFYKLCTVGAKMDKRSEEK